MNANEERTLVKSKKKSTRSKNIIITIIIAITRAF